VYYRIDVLLKGTDMVAVLSGTPLAAVSDVPTAVPQAPVRTESGRTPVRLTRRGRIVVASMSALVIGVLSVVLATAAQATHAGSASPGRYVAKVLVRPGQSLWSLAETYDPHADPRVISAQIQELNSMTSDQLRPGQVLWVPRG
jgi:LysM repeat protein